MQNASTSFLTLWVTWTSRYYAMIDPIIVVSIPSPTTHRSKEPTLTSFYQKSTALRVTRTSPRILSLALVLLSRPLPPLFLTHTLGLMFFVASPRAKACAFTTFTDRDTYAAVGKGMDIHCLRVLVRTVDGYLRGTTAPLAPLVCGYTAAE